MTASNLDFAFSFRRRFATCDRTVWTVTSSSLAMYSFSHPSARSLSTSSSRGVSGCTCVSPAASVNIVLFNDDQIAHGRRNVRRPFPKQVNDHSTNVRQPRDHHGPDVQPLDFAPRGTHRQFDGRRHQTGLINDN